MNNNVVEKTLKSIDNIDRLSDLAAISIYNTSHEAIDKFDVMQEHATPEYVEGEFVQESLLTGVLIGAGIIGVAISAFLIIKKIIESKAKGDPNAAPNTVAGVNLLNPEEIKKLFDGWNDKYFKNHPDLVVEGVPGADVSELNTYNGLLLGSIRTFCDNATKMIDGLNELSDADMKEAIDNLNKEFDSNINMDELVSKTGRVDKNTILQIKAASEDISKTLREFDAQVTNCIKEFRNKEKNNQNSDSDNEENKISEENIKLLEKALKAKANTAGAIMDNFRNKCLNGIAQALDAKVKEAEGQAKAKQQQELTPLTDDDKQTIIKSCVNLIKSGYEYSDEDISHYVTTHHTASPEEIQEIINAVRAETNGSPKESTGGPGSGTNPSQDESTDAETETPTPETDEASAENSDKHEETTETSSDNQLNGETSESEKLTSSETPKRADKVNITPEMEEKMKEVLLSAGEISQYGVIDESVVNHEIRQIKDMGLFKWTRSQYGDPNNVMSEQQDRCIKINNARYDAACNLAEVMGIDPDLVPKPTPLEQAATHTETPEGTPEAEPTKTETPANETEKKDEASSENTKENSNSEGTSLFDDTQVTPEKIEKVVSTIESWDPDITLTKKDRKYIDWFLSANNKDTGISDIIDILEKRYKELLNSNESGKLLTFNKYLQMAMISADINGLNAEEINAAFPQNRLDLLATKSEDMETPSTEEPSSSKTSNETSNTKLFTDEEEDKIVDAAYAVKSLDRKFRQEIYNAVTDDGFAEAAKKLYDKYADDANKLKQINETLTAMAKSIGKESEVPDLPTTESTPTESATPTENQNTDEASAEETTGTPEAPKEEEQSETSSEESNGNDIKKISDSTGLDEVKVENIYKILKDNSTPDDIKRAFIIDTIGPMIHMPGFNQKMANDGFKINYDNFKKVAEAASIPFEIEQPEISEKDINDMHTIISSADTEETKIAKIADNLMNSASAEKKAETEKPENEILNTADTIENANQDQNKPPTQITNDDLIAAKNANIDETIAERIAYAINNNKDITSTVVAPAIGTLLNDINEQPLNSFEQSQYLKTYNDLVKAFNYFHLDPNQYLDPEKYPDPKSLGILSDEEEAKQQQKNKWLVDLADKLFDYLSDNKTIAEFISDKKISEKDVADALNYIGMGDISVPIDENKVRKEMGISELKTQAAPTAQQSSPSNSSTGSRAGSNQQSAGKPVNKPGSNQRPAAPKQGAGQPAGKPVNKSGSGAKQQPANKPGIFERFGKFLGF